MSTPKHPAPFSEELIPEIAAYVDICMPFGGQTVLDPFAGIGRIHELRQYGYETIGIELEPEWAEQNQWTRVGNALDLPFADETIDAVVTSPCYGNRMADHHNAQDPSHRRTYKHYLGRSLTPGNAGAMQWGEEYRLFHMRAWLEAHRVLRYDGLFILNIKDHQRQGKRAHVSNWHYQTLKMMGFELFKVVRVGTPGYRFGENREVRYPERLLIFYKESVNEDARNLELKEIA